MFLHFQHKRRWAIFLLLLLCYIYFLQIYPRWVSPGELSRFLLISAVVDDGTLQIDESIRRFGDTQDKAVFGGHFYSEKAIGLSLFGIPFYAIWKLLCRIFHLQPPVQLTMFWIRFCSVTLPTLFFLPTLEHFWRRIRPDGALIAPFIFLFAFGTIAFTYALQLVSHQLLGIVLFWSFYLIYCCKADGVTTSRLLGAGVFSGFAATLEFPAVFAVIALYAYAFWILPEKRKLLWILLPAIPFLLLILGYNYAVFGNPFELAYRHKVEPFQVYTHAQGFGGIRLPTFEALYGLLLSKQHGMFYLSPFLLLALPGFYCFVRDPKWYKEAWLFAFIVISVIFVYCGFYYWVAGWNLGPRYLTPIIPFLTTLAFVFCSRDPILKWKWIRLVLLFLGLVSLTLVLVGTITFPFHPAEMQEPFFHFYAPLFLHGGFGWNLGNLLSLPSFGAGLLFFTILLITFLVMSLPEGTVQACRSAFVTCIPVAALLLCLTFGYARAGSPNAFDRFSQGRAYYFLGKDELAEVEYREALKLNPAPKLRELTEWYMERLYSTKRVRVR